jgi:NitT/TauT family transport system substrate-binding protein
MMSNEGIGNMTMKIPTMLLATLLALGLMMGTGCDSSKSKEPSGRSAERLTVGTVGFDRSSLIWVAKRLGYFTEQGLDIDVKLYESGQLALQDVFAGKLDLATATEFVAVLDSFEHPDLRIISILDEGRDQELVARKDRGITKLSDLRNKRIGVARNTSAEYHLDLALLLERMRLEDVKIVDLLPSEQIKALAKGDIDAVVVWEPFATMAKKELGTNAVSWPGQSGQDDYWLLLGIRGTIEKRTDQIRRFLTALASAEAFIKNDNNRAMEIVAKELADSHSGSSWKNHRFGLGLHRPLVLKMQAELNWLSAGAGADRSPVPDVYDLIYVDALRQVAKEKIEMIK